MLIYHLISNLLLLRQGDLHVHIEEMLHRITKAAAKA